MLKSVLARGQAAFSGIMNNGGHARGGSRESAPPWLITPSLERAVAAASSTLKPCFLIESGGRWVAVLKHRLNRTVCGDPTVFEEKDAPRQLKGVEAVGER